MQKDGQKIWGEILSVLKSQISQSNFKTWFSGSLVLEYRKSQNGQVLVVGVKNSFIKEQLEKRYLEKINHFKENKGLNELEVLFVVSSPVLEKKSERSPLFSGEAQEFLVRKINSNNLSPAHTFSSFVVGTSNNLAYIAAKSVVGTLGSLYNPLLVWGQSGVGKTHLLQAIGNDVMARVSGSKVLYATAEKFTNDYLESLHNKTQAAFRHKYRSLDLLLIDDVQFLAGKESTQDEFFHTFNELVMGGNQVVLVSDRHPKELGKLKERLVSRFLGGMVVDVGLPDLETRIAIIKNKCTQINIKLEDSVVMFIAQECGGSTRELEGILTTVLAYKKMGGRDVGIDDIKSSVLKGKNFLADLPPSIIVQEVCKHYRVRRESLCGPSRKASVVFARQVVMYLLRKELQLPLGEIGNILGGRDHSTVIYGIEKIEKRVVVDPVARDEVLRVREIFNK